MQIRCRIIPEPFHPIRKESTGMKHRQKQFAALALAAALVFSCLLTGTAWAEKTGKVHGGWLILRSEPSTRGRKISSYPSGTVVRITGQSGKWYAVEAPDGLTGYMLGSYLTVSGDDLVEGQDAWVTSRNGLNVKLRSGPGTRYGAVASYPPGTKCTVIGKYGSFTQIRIGSLTGYMMTQYLTGSDPGTGGGTVLYDVYVVSANGAGVNMRSGPSKGSNAIGFYDVGTKAGMIKPGTTWSMITIDGREGYMMSQFLSKTRPGPYTPTKGSYVVSYNGKNINLRNGPGLSYPAIGSYAPGTPLTILTPGSDWHFIRINGTYGYMMAQFIITK